MYFQLMGMLNLNIAEGWPNVHEYKEPLCTELCFPEVICAVYH